jgi:hypothetical protein
LTVLILRSGVFAASRRMSATLSWFETALKKRLLTMRAGRRNRRMKVSK